MTGDLWLVDTNVLAYAYDAADKRQARAAVMLEDCFHGTHPLAVSLQNLNELFATLTRKGAHPIPVPDARRIIREFLVHENWVKLFPTGKTLDRAMTLVEAFRTPFWDALIAAVAVENGVVGIYTEDVNDFARVPGLRVVNPFKAQSS